MLFRSNNIVVALIIFFNIVGVRAAIAQQQSEEAAIIGAIEEMWRAVEEQDLERYLSYIHDDYSVFGESDVYLHEGKDKEARDYRDFLSRAKVLRTFMHQPKVSVRGDTAWISYYWSDAGIINDKRYTSRGKSTRIFVKEQGQWLCIHSHFTEVP